MSGVRSEKWSDERLAQVKALMFEGFSLAQIGEKLDPRESRNAVIGIITRNKDFFKDAPRRPATRPPGSVSKARRKPEFSPSRPPREIVPEGRAELNGLEKLEGRPQELHPNWKQATNKGQDRLFIYWKLETEPTFIFKRNGPGSNWRGHGVYAAHKGLIFGWVNIQKGK